MSLWKLKKHRDLLRDLDNWPKTCINDSYYDSQG